MAKKKNAELNEDDVFAQFAKDSGGDVLADLDSIKFFIDTGSLAVNYCCCGKFLGGGVPSGRITEIYGPSSSGKSLLATNVLYGCQLRNGWAILLDCENASNGAFMEKVSHLNLKRVLRYTPFTLEEAFLKIQTVTKMIREKEKAMGWERRPIVIVYDSITVSPCERELKETQLPENYTPADWKKIVGRQEQPGERAKVCSKELRKLGPILEKEDVSVIIINQVRDKIGVLYGNPETTGGGGRSLEFYASLRFRTQQKKKIEVKSLGKYAGVNMQCRNIKNRTFRPFVSVEDVKLYFDNGIDPLSGVLLCLIEDERIIQKGAGNYEVAAAYLPEGVTEYKFKANKTENIIKKEVLLDCPKLVDASSREELEEYLARFQGGLDATESGEFEEKDAPIEEFDEMTLA